MRSIYISQVPNKGASVASAWQQVQRNAYPHRVKATWPTIVPAKINALGFGGKVTFWQASTFYIDTEHSFTKLDVGIFLITADSITMMAI